MKVLLAVFAVRDQKKSVSLKRHNPTPRFINKKRLPFQEALKYLFPLGDSKGSNSLLLW
jgi:hypothetical protein